MCIYLICIVFIAILFFIGWTVRTDTNFKHGKPLWLLGKQYLLEKLG